MAYNYYGGYPKEEPSEEEQQDDYQYLSEESKTLRVAELADKYGVKHSRLMWKIDYCVVPGFCLLYFAGFLNRNNFGLVYVDGIMTDLDMTKLDFISAYAAFFAPYIVLQFFSNYILKNIRPHFWVSISTLVYGSLTLASAFSKKQAHYIVCQVFHGVFQAGTEAAIFYILAHYYERRESQKRFSLICGVGALAGMSGNLINWALKAHMKDSLWPLWKWLLLIEGSLTIAISFLLFLIVPDFPEGARFFTDNETLFIVKKLEIYAGRSGYSVDYTAKEVLSALADPMIFLAALMSFGVSFNAYTYSLWESVFALGLGFELRTINRNTSLMYVAAFIWTLVCAWFSDYFQKRYIFFFLNCVICMTGFLIAYCEHSLQFSHAVRYTAAYFTVAGATAAYPLILCWSSLNLCGHLRKSIAIAVEVSFGSMGGLVAVFSTYDNDMLHSQALISAVSMLIFAILMATAYVGWIHRENKKKRSSLYKDNFEQFTAREKVLLGDKSPNFDYMY